VRAAQRLSRDPDLKWLVETDLGTLSAIDIQRAYWQAAHERFAGRDPETDWVLQEWQTVLDTLESDPDLLADRLDWVAKRQLLNLYVESEGLSWEAPALFALDLEYHNIDPQEGLYYALLEQGQMRRLVSEEAIEQAMHNPPMDTRAAIRGLCVQRFAEQIETLNWERILLRHADQTVRLDLSRLVEQDVRPLSRRLTAAPDVTTFVRMVKEFA
jgi:hypothetical protein